MMKLMRFGFFSALLLFSILLAGHEVYANEADYVWIENADGTVTITKYNDPIRFNNHVMVPEQLGGKIVSAIGDFAFYDGYIVGVTLPNTITSIGNEAFAKNSVLRDVILPSGLVRIGDYAFRNNQISNINLPDSIKHIGFAAFSYNSLTSVLLPNGITSIGQFSFANNQITAVSIPDSMTRIDPYAFTNNKLTAVTLPKSVIEVDNHAFSVNPQLSEVTIYSSATDLSSVSFPDNGPQLTIYGHASSPAQYLAQNKGYLFEPFKNSVVYDGNGHIGGNVPVDNNMYVRLQQATVLGNTGLLERLGYRFSGWNSAADGSGDDYAVNSKVTIGEEDVVLFAKWVPDDAKAPTITHASTVEDTQSTGGLVITPNASETGMVTHYWISAIVGGTLYKGNGMTQISNGEFITVHEGAAGLKFTPDADANSMDGSVFTFQVQASYDHNGAGLSLPAHASITVTEMNDPPVANNVILSAMADNSGTRRISFAEILASVSPGPTNESNQKITIIAVDNAVGGTVAIEGEEVLFTLSENYYGQASFRYTVTDNGTSTGLPDPKSAIANVSFDVLPRSDAPTVTDAVTAENTRTASGLVISPTHAGGSTTTHYKMSSITGGMLFHDNGTTQIINGDFITAAEGNAGLKFTPKANANSVAGDTFSFQIQAAPNTNDTLLSHPVTAIIHVTEVNDVPVAVDDTLPKVKKGAGKFIIAFADLFMNDSTGPANESLQSLTIIDVENAIGGTVAIVNGHIEFDLDPTFVGTAKFSYKVQDDGTTNGIDDFKTAGATVSFEVIEVIDEVKPNITLKGDNPVYLLLGEPYNEPGYTAYDDTDKDVTAGVTVQGFVDTQTLGSYELVYQVTDLSGNDADEVIRIVHVVSNDLENLTAGTSGLQPAFDPAITLYSMQVPYSVNVLHVAASLLDLSATLTIDGEAKGNNESKSVSLREGNNNITILVTAQGGATKMYTINVARASAPSYNGGSVESLPLLSDNAHMVELQVWGGGEKLQLNPSFASYINKYTIQTEAEQIEMLIELAHPKAKVMWNDRVITGKVKIELKEGENTFVFTVQAEDGTKKEYTLTVHSTTTLLEQPQASVRSYTDIAGHWAEDYIQRASAKGIVRGYPNGMFKPNSPITRAEFTVMLVATLNPKGQNATLVFADHEQIGEWAKQAVARAVQAGIVYGYSDGSFRPKAQITRAEMALMIARALKQQLDDNVTTSFADDEKIPGWAKSAVEVIRKLGIVDGRSGNYFVPNESATRAEAVVMLVRMLLR